ncbi:MAG: hypothetical protein ACTSWA_00705 [Candidatus Thorarchaeota archaeon]
MDDNYDEEQSKRERARRYLISVAELNQLIVRELTSSTDGFSVDDVVEQFPGHSLLQIKDALESVVEDEYFEVKIRDDGSLLYIPIIYDEHK